MGLNLLLIIILCWSNNAFCASGKTTKEERPQFPKIHELQRSQPIEDGEFECVDIYKQPAFEHPLLKSHKVQLWPSFLKRTIKRRSSYIGKSSKVDEVTEGCPPGKVPIQKLKLQNTKFHMFSKEYPGQHFVTLETTQSRVYHGASANINDYNPAVKMDQYSMALIWLQNGPPVERNSLQVGWAVHPKLYGDNATRVTGYWTVDGYRKTGCYNVMCPGFVQVHPTMRLGQKTGPPSIFGGEQWFVGISIKQDRSTGHWWFIGANDSVIGYWPKQIFTHLADGASSVKYGGTTLASPNGISPPMGSGEFPSAKYGRAAAFAQVKVVNSEFKEADIYPNDVKISNDAGSHCYDLLYHGDEGPAFRQAFLYGGPGGQCGT